MHLFQLKQSRSLPDCGCEAARKMMSKPVAKDSRNKQMRSSSRIASRLACTLSDLVFSSIVVYASENVGKFAFFETFFRTIQLHSVITLWSPHELPRRFEMVWVSSRNCGVRNFFQSKRFELFGSNAHKPVRRLATT